MPVLEHDISTGLSAFLRSAQSDARLSCAHMSLYLVLYEKWLQNRGQSPFSISRAKVMYPAKMSIATYHKCMKDLHAFGYITYTPSYHPGAGSSVSLNYTRF